VFHFNFIVDDVLHRCPYLAMFHSFTAVVPVTDADGNYASPSTSPRVHRPVFRLHYTVFYNVSLRTTHPPLLSLNSTSTRRDAGPTTPVPDVVQKVSNDCAKLYARTFLENLLSIEGWLNDLCVADAAGIVGHLSTVTPGRLHVRVLPVVLVTVYGVTVR